MTKHRFLVEAKIFGDPFEATRTCLNTDRVGRLRDDRLDDVTDLDAAYELIRLAMGELEAFGTGGGEIFDEVEIALLLRSLCAVLKRLGITLDLPFRDFKSFKFFWKQQGMSGSYDARRSYIHGLFDPVLDQLDEYHPHLRKNRDQTRRITDVTRRRLREGLAHTQWWGTLDEVEFLDRLYDLDNLPSHDPRFATAAMDIWQHCIHNPADWEGDWIWHDKRLGLTDTDSDETLLRFLVEMLHPAVLTDLAEVDRLQTFFNEMLVHDGYEIVPVDSISGSPVFAARAIGGGVPGVMKNLFFAAVGPKPEIVLEDFINNDVLVVKNEQFCLVYDQPLGSSGLTWGDMIAWWRAKESIPQDVPDIKVGHALYRRLWRSLHNDPKQPKKLTPERRVFRAYCELYPINDTGARYPALIPQVYLHYDPKTRKQRGGKDSVLGRERMDFLLLRQHGKRIVLEVDGQHHYAEGAIASPRLYSKMVAEDRALRLKGYEVYRFGGHELLQDGATDMLRRFFAELLGTGD
ncbi:hypothetical protein [Actinomadura monticuli]|uniref:AbiJ-NTD3 domain-containing protein n=1 Tax=Actinomadura monticuli TaxID=3097367 RepID=A0ABV4Q787_9ACTN